MKKIQTTSKQIREEIFRRWKISVFENFHNYLVERHVDKLVIKIASERQVQKMLETVEDIQKHLIILKIMVKGNIACVVINGNEIGIQEYCYNKDQCFKILAMYKDDEIHTAVDRSESRVRAMIEVALDSQLLHPFLILKEFSTK
ncbi:MAG: hypothetical protein EZS28_013763 [Streblomastix strix]|uniref:Uncharacterized protein n=1 Tax=Streblomastix strix TaxID=222440 RepID=A0A5J4W8J1_9EUKA|nr:MAG: hypothetical protein EZS28_013763 [Streblomastix strix]